MKWLVLVKGKSTIPSAPITFSVNYFFSNFADLIRGINDPEHPLSLEQLNVVGLEHVEVNVVDQAVKVLYTPTIPHCSMATLIGLSIKIQLLQTLPMGYWVDVRIREGTHVSEEAVNKQLGDKERVSAALENPHLYNVVLQCLNGPPRPGIAL